MSSIRIIIGFTKLEKIAMRINFTETKLVSSVTIGVICIIGFANFVRAEPLIGQIVVQTPDDSVTSSKLPEGIANPASASGDVDDDKNKATVVKPAQEPLIMDRRSMPSPAGENEKLPIYLGNRLVEAQGPSAIEANVIEGVGLSREFKEAVRPLYEDLAGSTIVETLRDLKSDVGLNGSLSFADPASSDYSKNRGNSDTTESAPWEKSGRHDSDNRRRSAAEIEKDKLATAIMLDDFIETVKPWLYGLTTLYVLGYMVKLGRNYFAWKTARSRKRALRGRRRHQRPQGPTDSRSA